MSDQPHPLLRLPFPIWSSLAGAGLCWKQTLSPETSPEYHIRVTRILKSGVLSHHLVLAYEEGQYRVIKATNRFPQRLIEELDWRMSMERAIRESLG